MKKVLLLAAAAAACITPVAFAQNSMSGETATQPAAVVIPPVPPAAGSAATSVTLPADTLIVVTPIEEISSKKMKEGTFRTLQVANDVTHNGVVVIPRGAQVKAEVTWRTGKGIGGKSAKFELTFRSVAVGSREFALKVKHRQEGRGNTVAALLGSMLISGRSAVITSGQLVNAFTAEPIAL